MKTFVRIVALLAGIGLLAAGAVWVWAGRALEAKLSKTWEVHDLQLAIPTPLTDEEIAELRALPPDAPPDAAPPEVDVDAVALERAQARGKHLVEAIYGCTDCHGEDYGGGTMIDDPWFATFYGPNLTRGGVTADFTPADWDRAIRHGVLPDGRASVMSSIDFVGMSDQELSDIVAWIQSLPPVDRVMPPRRFGPVGRFLIATGEFPLSAARIDHDAPHRVAPPPALADVAFGAHIANVCTGCHGKDLTGGPIPGGSPDWGPAANLTPSADGLAGWDFHDFVRAMHELKRPDGTAIREPMSLVAPYAARMTDTELRALWMYLQSVEARPDP